MNKSKVYFSRTITPENVVELFNKLNKPLNGNVAVKVHSGEKGNQNFLKPEFWKPLVNLVNGTIVECNTAYGGARNETHKHEQLMREHGWSEHFKVDILDSKGPDDVLKIPEGQVIQKNYVGKNLALYDSMLVLSHFKGHPMGGYGGALKQLSIGLASSAGKCYIHSAGATLDQNEVWGKTAPQNKFLESMADAAKSVIDFFDGNIAYVNVMKNLSVDCDCCEVAEDPCMSDIGILASLDPVALDQACVDLIYNATNDPGQKHFLKRLESRNGTYTIDIAEKIGCGLKEYELIEID